MTEMRKIFYFILYMPIIGLLSVYIYTLITMLSINSTKFYNYDPKNTPVNFLYDFIYPIPFFGHIAILLGVFIIMFDYTNLRNKLIPNYVKFIYLIGVIMTIFTHYSDLGYCQIWFFD